MQQSDGFGNRFECQAERTFAKHPRAEAEGAKSAFRLACELWYQQVILHPLNLWYNGRKGWVWR